ncbi:hypothetical protein V8B97DRAFT_1257941 [Scleroderma yunnanense]
MLRLFCHTHFAFYHLLDPIPCRSAEIIPILKISGRMPESEKPYLAPSLFLEEMLNPQGCRCLQCNSGGIDSTVSSTVSGALGPGNSISMSENEDWNIPPQFQLPSRPYTVAFPNSPDLNLVVQEGSLPSFLRHQASQGTPLTGQSPVIDTAQILLFVPHFLNKDHNLSLTTSPDGHVPQASDASPPGGPQGHQMALGGSDRVFHPDY